MRRRQGLPVRSPCAPRPVTCRIMKPEFQAGLAAHQERWQQAGLRIGHLLDSALGNSPQNGEPDPQLVSGHRERLAVEIAAANHIS